MEERTVLWDGGQRRTGGVRRVPDRAQERADLRHADHDVRVPCGRPVDRSRRADDNVLRAAIARDGHGRRLRDRAQLRVGNSRYGK